MGIDVTCWHSLGSWCLWPSFSLRGGWASYRCSKMHFISREGFLSQIGFCLWCPRAGNPKAGGSRTLEKTLFRPLMPSSPARCKREWIPWTVDHLGFGREGLVPLLFMTHRNSQFACCVPGHVSTGLKHVYACTHLYIHACACPLVGNAHTTISTHLQSGECKAGSQGHAGSAVLPAAATTEQRFEPSVANWSFGAG